MKKLLLILSTSSLTSVSTFSVISCAQPVSNSAFKLSDLKTDLGQIHGPYDLPSIFDIAKGLNDVNENITILQSDIAFVNGSLTSTSVIVKAISNNFTGVVKVNFTWKNKKYNLDEFIKIKNLGSLSGYSELPSEEEILDLINTKNNLNFKFEDISIKIVDASSSTIESVKDSELYEGSAQIVYSYKQIEKEDLAEYITTKDLGEFKDYNENVTEEQILNRINEKNKIKLTTNDINFSSVTNSSAVIMAKSDSIKYKGTTDIKFVYKQIEKEDLNVVISNKSLGEIKGGSNTATADQILRKINETNSINLTANDIEINSITLTNAVVMAKSDSIKYKGTVTIEFNYVKLNLIPLENLIYETNLGTFYSNTGKVTSEDIKDGISSKNGEIYKSLLYMLDVSNITTTSAVINANSKYKTFIGTVNLKFTISKKQKLDALIKNNDVGEIRGAIGKDGWGNDWVYYDATDLMKKIESLNSGVDFKYIKSMYNLEPYGPKDGKYFLSIDPEYNLGYPESLNPYEKNSSVFVYFSIDGDTSILEKQDLNTTFVNKDLGMVEGYTSSPSEDIGVWLTIISNVTGVGLELQSLDWKGGWTYAGGKGEYKLKATNQNASFTGEVTFSFEYKQIPKKANLKEIITDNFLGDIIAFKSSTYVIYESTILKLLNLKYPGLGIYFPDVIVETVSDPLSEVTVEINSLGAFEGDNFKLTFNRIKAD